MHTTFTDLSDVLTDQVQAWVDATDNGGLEEVRSTPTINGDVDQQLICDIQRAVSRLIGKAPQLIGMKIIFISQNTNNAMF